MKVKKRRTTDNLRNNIKEKDLTVLIEDACFYCNMYCMSLFLILLSFWILRLVTEKSSYSSWNKVIHSFLFIHNWEPSFGPPPPLCLVYIVWILVSRTICCQNTLLRIFIYIYIRIVNAYYLTIILRNRAQYHLILSWRGHRPSWLNQGIFCKILIDYHFQNKKNYGFMI